MSDEHIIGRDLNSRDHARLKQGLKLSGGPVSSDTYHHEEAMDQMVKAIQFTNMDRKTRAVLLLRVVHGFTIQRMQVHLFITGHLTGNSKDELEAIEVEGKRLVLETLQKHTMQDIVATINANSSVIAGLRNELRNPNIGLS